MREVFEDALEELKRVDHLMFVSLKYTRTCDVFKNIIERMINCYEILTNGLVNQAFQEKKTTGKGASVLDRVNILKELYRNNQIMHDTLNFYLKLRKISKADFTRRNEFRRHVTMTVFLKNNEMVEITIDSMAEYHRVLKEFFNHTYEMFNPKREE